MGEIRASILNGDFEEYYARHRPLLTRTDEDNPSVHPAKAKPVTLPRRGDYEVVTGPEGFSSIRQISSGEVMHSVSRPSDEANALYVVQSRLASRLVVGEPTSEPLVIWDVGLGAASNAMAAIECFEQALEKHGAGALRPLRVVSFECDLDPLILATNKSSRFPHLQHGAPHALLASGRWVHASGLLTWELLHGDFRELFPSAPAPDLIYYDPFSAKTDTGLWNAPLFARMRAHCAPRSAELFTYSAATAVRVALLAAGYCVAEGVGTGPKATTTVAFTGKPDPAWIAHLLGPAWLGRWRRSHSKYPADLPESERAAFERMIEAHPQFANG